MTRKVIPGLELYAYPKNALGRYQSCFSATLSVLCKRDGLLPMPQYLAREAGLGVYTEDGYFDVRPSGVLDTEAMGRAGLLLTQIPFSTATDLLDGIFQHLNMDLPVIVPVDAFYLPYSPLTFQTSHEEHDITVFGYDSDTDELLILDTLFSYRGAVDRSFFHQALGEVCQEPGKPPYWLYNVSFTPPRVSEGQLADEALLTMARRVLRKEKTPAPVGKQGSWNDGARSVMDLATTVSARIPLRDHQALEKAMFRLVSVGEKRMWLMEVVAYSSITAEWAERVKQGLKDALQLWMVTRLWLGKAHVHPTPAFKTRMADTLFQAAELEERVAQMIVEGFSCTLKTEKAT